MKIRKNEMEYTEMDRNSTGGVKINARGELWGTLTDTLTARRTVAGI